MTSTGHPDLIQYFDDTGKPVTQQDPYLADLWLNVAKCDLVARNPTKDDDSIKFDPQRFYGPIQGALASVDCMLTVMQECRKSDLDSSMLKSLKGEPDDPDLLIKQDRREMYKQSAAWLRQQALLLNNSFVRFNFMLNNVVKPLIHIHGYPVDYTRGMWIVDFGYRHMFRKFNAHYESVEGRGTFFVIRLSEKSMQIEYKMPKEDDCECELRLDELFPTPLENNDVLYDLLSDLNKSRQLALERDFYNHLLLVKKMKRHEVLLITKQDLLPLVKEYLLE